MATKYYCGHKFQSPGLTSSTILPFFFQHVVIVNNEIHSSSCVLHYYECSRNHALSASQLELFFHLVQVKNKSFKGLVYHHTFTAGCPMGVSNRHARTPAFCKATSFLQIRCGNFQNGLFRP